MPVFNSLQMDYGIHPGILISENQIEATELKRFVHRMLIIKRTAGKESFGLEYKLSGTENQITDTVRSVTRNIMLESFIKKMASKELIESIYLCKGWKEKKRVIHYFLLCHLAMSLIITLRNVSWKPS
jgi:hypothetical protein